MNDLTVDFSKTDIRKLSQLLSQINFQKKSSTLKTNTESKSNSVKISTFSKKEVPHELRKAKTVLKLLESSGKYSEADLKPFKERIEKLNKSFN